MTVKRPVRSAADVATCHMLHDAAAAVAAHNRDKHTACMLRTTCAQLSCWQQLATPSAITSTRSTHASVTNPLSRRQLRFLLACCNAPF
jgi:hypothetical protein